MELSSSKIKNISYTFGNETFLIYFSVIFNELTFLPLKKKKKPNKTKQKKQILKMFLVF